MKSLWDAAPRQELIGRLASLTRDTTPRWGRFTAPKMLAHVNDAMRMATGELRCASKGGPLRAWPLRKLLIYVLPWPQGAPSAPELLERSPSVWEDEVDAFRSLVRSFGLRSRSGPMPEHPAFGPLTATDWGALGYKHIDHHFTQFNV